jgi:hypothetical protein
MFVILSLLIPRLSPSPLLRIRSSPCLPVTLSPRPFFSVSPLLPITLRRVPRQFTADTGTLRLIKS